jgi:two-component system, OmpR family, response regulator
MDTQPIGIDISAMYRIPRKGHVLVVDDDAATRERLADYLTLNDFRVTPAQNSKQMMEILNEEAVDLVALELTLHGEDGHQLARRLREVSMVPIIIVTSRTEEADRVMGLELGADDYVTKPFSTRELLARIRAVMRRYQTPESPAEANRAVREYHFAGWTLNLPLHALRTPAGERVPISNGEFGLLVALLSHPQRILTRDQLLELSRLRTTEVYDRAIDIQILRLRRKIESNPARPELIKTERGIGYRFCASVASVHSSSKQSTAMQRPARLGEEIHVRNGSSYARNDGGALPGVLCR